MLEKELEQQIKYIADDLRLLRYHTYDSRRSPLGFPDCVFAGPGGVLFRELKTVKGKLTPAQDSWGKILREAGADWDVWRPPDLFSGRVARELAAISPYRRAVRLDERHDL